MTNPVPSVAFYYVCDYLAAMLHRLMLSELDYTCAVSKLTDIPQSISCVIAAELHKCGYLCYRSGLGRQGITTFWGQLTGRGYLFALELHKQRRIDSSKLIGYHSE